MWIHTRRCLSYERVVVVIIIIRFSATVVAVCVCVWRVYLRNRSGYRFSDLNFAFRAISSTQLLLLWVSNTIEVKTIPVVVTRWLFSLRFSVPAVSNLRFTLWEWRKTDLVDILMTTVFFFILFLFLCVQGSV